MARRYWLVKSEPDVYSIADLERDGVTAWEGVRNYQARNYMRDGMAVGDLVLFYHSNTDPAGVVGVAKVVGAARADATQFDPSSEYHDRAATRDAPRWVAAELGFVERFGAVVPLGALKADAALADMFVTRRGMRLSVQPVDRPHFSRVLALGKARTRAR